jgi:hypothetical protein
MILKNYHQNLLLFCRNPSFLLNMITYLAATFYRKKKTIQQWNTEKWAKQA